MADQSRRTYRTYSGIVADTMKPRRENRWPVEFVVLIGIDIFRRPNSTGLISVNPDDVAGECIKGGKWYWEKVRGQIFSYG